MVAAKAGAHKQADNKAVSIFIPGRRKTSPDKKKGTG
jgi:hypothetical protein